MLVIDCTELWQNPIRAGIQRVVRELLRHWPYDQVHAQPARFDPTIGLIALPERAVEILTEQEPGTAAMPPNALLDALRRVEQRTQVLPSKALVLIPEVFYDPIRCKYYEDRQPAMLAYDFLPWLRPELFASSSMVGLMPYLRLIRSVPNVAFISEQTKRDYEKRIAHHPAIGPVLPLGADGLPMERQTWDPSRRGYVSIGSLDTRKNHHLIAEAFISLWRQGHDISLTLIGRAFSGHQLYWLTEARQFPQFQWVEGANDIDIANALESARASIYLSEAEGFGLPPIESLAAGVPVIAASSCPSVEMLQPRGIWALPEVSAERIAVAVLSLENDATIADLWRQAASAQLSTWREFALATAEWLQSCDLAASVPHPSRSL